MNTKLTALVLVIMIAALVAGAIHLTNRRQNVPTQAVDTGASPVLTVDALASRAADYTGKPFALHGVVDRVSAEQGLIALIDPSEANCTDACQRNIVIVSMPAGADARLPAPRSEVLAHGVIETAGVPLRMAATRIVTESADIRRALAQEPRR